MEIARLQIAVDAANAKRELKQLGDQAKKAAADLNGLSSVAGKVGASIAAALSVSEIYQAAEAYQTITNRMKLVTSSAVELAAAQSAVFGIAQKSGQALTATAELYQRIAQNQDALKLSGEGVAGIVDTISKSMVVSGASASSAQAALIQLGQAFASGTLRGEELNAVMEQAPALAQAIARGMGVTVGQLRALGAEGKLTADSVVQALQSQAGAVDDLFGKMQDTMGTGLTRISNSFTRLVGKMNEVSGVSASIAGSFTSASSAIDSLTEDADSLAATVATVGAVMSGVAAGGAVLLADKLMVSVVASRAASAANIAQAESALQNAIANQRATQTAVVRATAEAQAARGTAVQTHMSIQLAQARMREAAATATATSAQVALTTASRGMLGVLGGPVGLALLAAGAAASYFLFRDATEDVQRSTLDLSAPLDQLTDKWRALGDAQRAVVGNELRLKIDESKQSIISLSSEVEAAFNDLGNTKGLPVEAWLAPMREFRQAALDGGGGIHYFAQALTDGHPAGSDFRVMVESLAAKIESERDSALKAAEGLKILENQTRANTSANQSLAGSTDSVGKKFLESLQQRADFAGRLTELQKVNIAIEKGYAGALSEADIALARSNASLIDRANATKGVTKATNEQANAYQSLYDSLYPAEAAQRQYNEQVALLSKYLTGDKLAAAISKLNESIGDGDHDAAAKAIEDYRKEVEQLEDRLDPVGKATKQYQKDVALLASAHSRGEISGEKYAAMLATLEGEYAKATEVSGEWAQWTESALERVDGAFADAWKNIGDGFAGFRDSLTNAFKQMLAELAHMAITKPIVMQIGAALGIGGAQSGGQGLLGSLLGGGGGGSGGGLNIGSLLQYGQQAYSLLTGVGPAALAGYQSGGIMGGLQGAAGYYGNLASSAWGTVSGWFGGGAAASAGAGAGAAGTGFGLGQSVVSGQIGSAAYAGAQSGAGGALSQLSGSLGSIAGPLAGLYVAFKGYKSISAGYEFNRKDFSDDNAGVKLGAGIIDAYENGVTKLFGNSSFISKAFRIPVATFGSILGGLFGGGWQTKDGGLAFGINSGELSAQRYEFQKKKGGLFGKNKKRTNFTDLDPESAAAFQDAFSATRGSVEELFEALSFTVEDGALAGLNLARTQISTQGKTEEEISQAIAEWFGTAAEAMNTELNKVLETGLNLDLAGMQAFVNNLKGVNEVLRYLNVDMYESTVAGGKLAESLAAVSGGLEALAQNSQTYYDAFFSQAEKTEDAVDAIQRAFKDADIELAGSREAYRAAVEAIDLTSEAGQQMFATMMALSGQAAAYFDIVEAQAADLMSGVNTAYNALVRSIGEQQKKLQEAAQVSQSNIAGMLAVANSLDAALKRLRGNSDLAVRSLRAQAVMTLNSALVSARAGNSLAGFEGLQDALDVASQMDTDLYATLADFEREQGRTANLIKELEKVNGKQLTAEQKILEGIDAQLTKLDQQLAFAQAQLDALNGIDKSVKSVEAAIAAMNASVVAALSAMADGLASKNTAANNSALIDSVYKSVLGRETDAAGAAFWQQQLASGNLDYDQLAKAIANDASKNANDPGAGSAADYLGSQGGLSVQDQVEAAYRATLGRSADIAGESYWMGLINSGAMTVSDLAAAIQLDAKVNGEIPGFAAGGFHSGGLRLVGENGPEIEATGPSRVFNAGQTADMLGGGSQADEVAAMRAEMTDALRAIAKHTQQTARRVEYLERWDFDGLPEQRAAV